MVGFTSWGKYAADAVFVNRTLVPRLKIPKVLLGDKILYFWRNYKPCLEKLSPWAIFGRGKEKLGYWRHLILRSELIVWGSPFLTFRRVMTYVWLKFIKRWLGLDLNFREGIKSDVGIDVVIPAAVKDVTILPFTVEGVRKNVKHPIGDIIVVSPRSGVVKEFCKRNGCVWVDESNVSPVAKSDIDYVSEGVDRSSWLFQQFLKLSADKVSSREYILLVDADTIFLRPHIFLFKGKIIFEQSMEYHQPYFIVFEKLFGRRSPSAFSFTSHHMLFKRSVLEELRRDLEKRHKKTWYRAIMDNIDTREFSAFSDYETYGIFFTLNYPKQEIREFWSHLDFPVGRFDNLREDLPELSRDYKSASFHVHESRDRRCQ